MAISIERIADVKNKLGEGPVWDVAEQAFYWIDGAAPAIYRLEARTNAIKEWKTPKAIGSFAIRKNGGAICALSDGFYVFDFTSGAATPIPDGLVAKSGTHFNDGKTDARGRFIAGTLDAAFKKSIGTVFSLDGSLKCSVLEPEIGCTTAHASVQTIALSTAPTVSAGRSSRTTMTSRPVRFRTSANSPRPRVSAEYRTARRSTPTGISGRQ